MFGIGGSELAIIGVVLLAGLPLYFLPSIVAGVRRHHNLFGVVLLNLFAGWTMIGWIAAMIWAWAAPGDRTPHAAAVLSPALTSCARCGSPRQPDWAFCPKCGAPQPA